MVTIWNEVVENGVAFPQEDTLDEVTGKVFFESQSYCGVAVDDNDEVVFEVFRGLQVSRSS